MSAPATGSTTGAGVASPPRHRPPDPQRLPRETSMSSSAEDLDLKVEDTDSARVVRVSGELDLASAPQLSAVLAEAAAGADLPVLLDLAEVTFIDSSALRALVIAGRELAAAGRVLQIGPRSEMVTRVLSMTSLDQHTDAFQVLPQTE